MAMPKKADRESIALTTIRVSPKVRELLICHTLTSPCIVPTYSYALHQMLQVSTSSSMPPPRK